MIIWIIGLSGSGKTTLGKLLIKDLNKTKKNFVFLDGDELRRVWVNKVGHTISGRRLNAERIFNLCKLLDRQNINVVCSIVSIFPDIQKKASKIFNDFKLIYLKTPLKILKKRDSKGIYKKNKLGKDKNVVGINLIFPKPYKPFLVINSYGRNNPKKIKDIVLSKIKLIND